MNEERVLELVRLRLLVRGKQTAKQLADSLLAYVDDGSPERWRERWSRSLDRLAREGDLDREALALTAKGRERALRSVGLAELPARTSWKALLRAYVVPRALGVGDDKAKKRLRTADGLRAVVLSSPRERQKTRTVNQAIDRMVWEALGLPADGPITPKKVRERVLARELTGGRPVTLDKAVRLAAARAVGATRTSPDALVDAVVRGWVSSPDGSARADEPEREDALVRFASRVLVLARDPATRHFTDDKAFIESVWRRAREAEVDAGDLPGFKRRLLEAHRRGLVVLSRADLTQLVDPRELAASELRVDGAAFHFVRTDLPEVSS